MPYNSVLSSVFPVSKIVPLSDGDSIQELAFFTPDTSLFDKLVTDVLRNQFGVQLTTKCDFPSTRAGFAHRLSFRD